MPHEQVVAELGPKPPRTWRGYCCMDDRCDYVRYISGRCPAHHTELCPLMLVAKRA